MFTSAVRGFKTSFTFQTAPEGLAFVIQVNIIRIFDDQRQWTPVHQDRIWAAWVTETALQELHKEFLTASQLNLTDSVYHFNYIAKNSQNPELGDPAEDHVSIHTNGKNANSAFESFSRGNTTTVPRFDDNSPHVATIIYLPGSSLQVYMVFFFIYQQF
jgi:hypothetical protein